jgi:NADPH:quinone reductase-like Zn-dependent oxidoreductase
MQVVELPHFGPQHLRFAQRPDPRPGPGEVVVRLRAASLNFRDLMMIDGTYNPRQPLPLVPLSDGAGEVVEIGAGVTRVRLGDRVAGLFSQRWFAGQPQRDHLRSTLGGPLDGALQELWCLSEEGVSKLPAHMSFAEGATLPCAALTAWSALVEQGGLKPGETVLVQGTGGVSIFAMQIAHLCGARVIVTSASDAKLERARAMGAWQTVNYLERPDWGKAVQQLSGGGVDHVVEVGGAGTLTQSLVAVRPGGHVAVIGVLTGGAGPLNLTPVLMANLRLQGVLVGHRDGFEAMTRAFDVHQTRPVVDRQFSWRDVTEALAFQRAGKHFGKVVLSID